MTFLRSILWVPMIFGIVMGGLALARLVSDGLGTEFAAVPADIMQAYTSISDALVHHLGELPFRIEVPAWMADFGVAYTVIAVSNARFLATVWG